MKNASITHFTTLIEDVTLW